MAKPDIAEIIGLGQGLLEGPEYNLITIVLAVAAILVGVAVPLYLAKKPSLGRRPRIALPADNAQAGATVVVTAEGFRRFEVVDLFFTDHPVAVKVPMAKRRGVVQAQADSEGRLSESVVVPATLPIGENLIVVERPGANSGPTEVSAKFYVLAHRAQH